MNYSYDLQYFFYKYKLQYYGRLKLTLKFYTD